MDKLLPFYYGNCCSKCNFALSKVKVFSIFEWVSGICNDGDRTEQMLNYDEGIYIFIYILLQSDEIAVNGSV